VADATMVRVYERVFQLAEDDLPVLVQGETGAGKELVAAALHYGSSRREGPYVTQNCAGLPEGTVDALLFGHERGAFTDVKEAQPGLFEHAAGGTLLLNEIGEMSQGTQAKLLRVLVDRKSARIGSKLAQREYHFRLVTTTNRDLRSPVQEGRFRQDLYQRINCATIFLKPLRERPSELGQLAEELLRRECKHSNRPMPRIANPVYEWMHGYPWPGNVRELRNLMMYLAATVRDSVIELWHLPQHFSETVPARPALRPADAPAVPPLPAPAENL
jgi:transcriptional regulator with PAS, ATPase and Fis domain